MQLIYLRVISSWLYCCCYSYVVLLLVTCDLQRLVYYVHMPEDVNI